MPDAVLGAGDTAVSKTKILAQGAYDLVEGGKRRCVSRGLLKGRDTMGTLKPVQGWSRQGVEGPVTLQIELLNLFVP